jgi:hypothetical protein
LHYIPLTFKSIKFFKRIKEEFQVFSGLSTNLVRQRGEEENRIFTYTFVFRLALSEDLKIQHQPMLK